MRKTQCERLKIYFLSHQGITLCIAIFFILCSSLGIFKGIYDAFHNYNLLKKETGLISYWGRTSGKYNTASLEIEGNSNIYKKDRVGGWINLQYEGVKGEEVVFYIIQNQEKFTEKEDYPQYFGLSNINNPRHSFWIFMDVLYYSYSHLILFLLLFVYGLLGFNWLYVKNKYIRYTSLALFAILIITFILSAIS